MTANRDNHFLYPVFVLRASVSAPVIILYQAHTLRRILRLALLYYSLTIEYSA